MWLSKDDIENRKNDSQCNYQKSFHELKRILDQSLSPKNIGKAKMAKDFDRSGFNTESAPIVFDQKNSQFLKMLFSTAQLKSVQDYSYFSFGGPVFFYLWGSYGVGKSL